MMIVHSHHIAGTWPIEKAKYTITLPASERFLRLKKLKLDDGDLININFGSDLTICLVKHNEFSEKRSKKLISNSNFVDYCNLNLSNK